MSIIAVLTLPVVAKQELKIAASISTSSQRAAYYNLARAFEEEHPDTQVTITSYTSEIYKAKFPQMLVSNQFDVLYWHAGERLFEHITRGKVSSLTDILPPEQMVNNFGEVIVGSASLKNEIYALPMSYYQIGFYYHKPLFAELGLNEPNTWREFILLCEALRQHNVLPIYIGTKSNWPATAWFDYLNLRLNGLAFHKSIISGDASFLDNRVTAVLQKLKDIGEANYFIQEHQHLDWKQGLPLLFRGLAGMTMLGNYAIQDFPERIKGDIGFFKFPVFDDQTDYVEETPLDVLVLPATSAHKELAKQFIRFAAQSATQEKFNQSLGTLSPHKGAQQNNSSLIQEAYSTIINARGTTQFFDRDSRKDYADQIMPVIDQFLIDLDIVKTQKVLEQIRLSLFSSEPVNKH